MKPLSAESEGSAAAVCEEKRGGVILEMGLVSVWEGTARTHTHTHIHNLQVFVSKVLRTELPAAWVVLSNHTQKCRETGLHMHFATNEGSGNDSRKTCREHMHAWRHWPTHARYTDVYLRMFISILYYTYAELISKIDTVLTKLMFSMIELSFSMHHLALISSTNIIRGW